MNFTNINDPAGVKALLDQLRVSQAWKDAVAPQAQESQPAPVLIEQQETPVATNSKAPVTSSVAALLSQLQSPSSPPSSSTSTDAVIARSIPLQPLVPTLYDTPPIRDTPDPRTLTFQQALPLLAQLGDDPKLVAVITQLKKEQEDLERRLWEDRRNIVRKYEEKVKVAATKANMIGDPGLSKHEAEMLQDGLKTALEKFDRERVLVAWDGLVSKQQTILSNHSVPTMFPTVIPADPKSTENVYNSVSSE
ncbi:hypothetical protein DXG01_015835 [Tephrocybe rancida]|nr:hypothetical protein DXG01_015835 [Tephrocybe rancida]